MSDKVSGALKAPSTYSNSTREPRAGDRVQVCFEATASGSLSARCLWVTVDGDLRNFPVPASAVSLIAPAVAVGDTLTVEQADSLPDGSVVYSTMAYEKDGNSWLLAGVSDEHATLGDWLASGASVEVLRVGGTA